VFPWGRGLLRTNFVTQVNTLRANNKLTSAKAKALLTDADEIMDSIGCN